jgi:hypothetical protein
MNLKAVYINQSDYYLFTSSLDRNNIIIQVIALIKKGEKIEPMAASKFISYGIIEPNNQLVANLIDWPPEFDEPDFIVGPINVALLKYKNKQINKDVESMAELWQTTPDSLLKTILIFSPQKDSEKIN